MRWVILLLILIAAVSLVRWARKAPRAGPPARELTTEMVQDPNCETYVPETEAVRATIDGRDYCFCSEKCAEEYRNKRSAV